MRVSGYIRRTKESSHREPIDLCGLFVEGYEVSIQPWLLGKEWTGAGRKLSWGQTATKFRYDLRTVPMRLVNPGVLPSEGGRGMQLMYSIVSGPTLACLPQFPFPVPFPFLSPSDRKKTPPLKPVKGKLRQG